MKSRFIVLLLVLLMVVPFVGAQEEMACFGFSEADCAVLMSATANSATVTSASFDIDMSLNVTGVPESGPINAVVTGSGQFMWAEGFDPATLANMGSMDSFPGALKVDLNVVANDGTADQNMVLSVVIVDDVIYVLNPEDGKWYGSPISEMSDGMEQSMGVDDPAEALGAMGMDPAMIESLTALSEVPGFITTVREGDTFKVVINLTTLFSAPEFMTILQEVGEASGDASMAQMGMILPMIISEAEISVSETVDTGLNVINGVGLTAHASIDAGMLSGETDMDPIVVDFSFNINLRGINEGADIVAPEGAIMEQAAS
ncbi:hypothetical protein MASR2M15_04070 [Anaerolineales bacterium]|jgi:hypothetical protein